MKRITLLIIVTLSSQSMLGTPSAEYKCGHYKVEFVGPDATYLWGSEPGEYIGHWGKEEGDDEFYPVGNEPPYKETIYEKEIVDKKTNKKKTVTHLYWDKKEYSCEFLRSSLEDKAADEKSEKIAETSSCPTETTRMNLQKKIDSCLKVMKENKSSHCYHGSGIARRLCKDFNLKLEKSGCINVAPLVGCEKIGHAY